MIQLVDSIIMVVRLAVWIVWSPHAVLCASDYVIFVQNEDFLNYISSFATYIL